jgi:hypothetical protein
MTAFAAEPRKRWIWRVAANDNYAMHSPDAIFEMRADTLITHIQPLEAHAVRDR